jgi:predicted NBD/HSP70 family sugar kinase
MAEDAGMDFDTLCQRYQEQDPQIVALIQEKSDILAVGISNMLAMQPLKEIVLGGEIRKLGEPFLNTLRESMKRNGFYKVMNNLDVRFSLDAEIPEILGAMWNFVENQMDIYSLMG